MRDDKRTDMATCARAVAPFRWDTTSTTAASTQATHLRFHSNLRRSSIPGAFDPFLEFDAGGFRGEGNTCSRSCSDFIQLEQLRHRGHSNDELHVQSPALFSRLGFLVVVRSTKSAMMPKGAYYWWNGAPQTHPNPEYQTAALNTLKRRTSSRLSSSSGLILMIAKAASCPS